MSVEENLQKIDASIEAFNDHDVERFAGLRAESHVFQAPDLPEPLKGREALREYLQGFVDAFPDGQVEKLRAFGQGDWAVVEFAFTGTNSGPLPGPGGKAIPATNKPVRFVERIVLKFEDGEITAEHHYWDQLGLMSQLGLAP